MAFRGYFFLLAFLALSGGRGQLSKLTLPKTHTVQGREWHLWCLPTQDPFGFLSHFILTVSSSPLCNYPNPSSQTSLWDSSPERTLTTSLTSGQRLPSDKLGESF